jgi:hypothetical protein
MLRTRILRSSPRSVEVSDPRVPIIGKAQRTFRRQFTQCPETPYRWSRRSASTRISSAVDILGSGELEESGPFIVSALARVDQIRSTIRAYSFAKLSRSVVYAIVRIERGLWLTSRKLAIFSKTLRTPHGWQQVGANVYMSTRRWCVSRVSNPIRSTKLTGAVLSWRRIEPLLRHPGKKLSDQALPIAPGFAYEDSTVFL